MTENVGSKRQLPAGWRWVRLGDVCEINPRRPEINRKDDRSTSFVQMSSVQEAGRGIARIEEKPFSTVCKGYTYFGEGDVLFAKITPCMQNGKHAIARGLIDGIGFGSTEFHVLRPRSEIISEWVHHFILQPWVLQNATAHFSGAVGQQRVPEDYLAELKVPLPSVPEQQRIAAILTEQMAAVDRARAAAEAQLEAAKALPAAYLRDVFGMTTALLENGASKRQLPAGWQWVPLGEIGPVTDGDWILNSDYAPSGVRLLQVGDVGIGRFVDKSSRFITENRARELNCTFLKAGDVLISRMPDPIGRACQLPDLNYPCITAVDVSIWRPNDNVADRRYLVHYLNSPEWFSRVLSLASGATRARISRSNLETLKILLPPLPEQTRIAAILTKQVAAVDRAIVLLTTQRDTINALPATLLRQAFNGEL